MEFEGGDLVFGCEGGNCCVVWVEELSNETSSGGDRRRGCHPECDPTILGVAGEGDLKLDR